MICLIANSFKIAEKYAFTQNLDSSEWFYLSDETDVLMRTNFHVIVVGEIQEDRLKWFEKMYLIAKRQGLIGRRS